MGREETSGSVFQLKSLLYELVFQCNTVQTQMSCSISDQTSQKRSSKSSSRLSRLQTDGNILPVEVCDDVETLIMFIGYPRSGHSLIGSLIDAHPHAIVANEFDLVGSWKAWDSRQQNKYYMFSQLYKNSQEQIMGGYRTHNARHFFDYSVPNQWQGKFKNTVKVTELQIDQKSLLIVIFIFILSS